jgi:V/A-type H+-transporting ATPase subunit B
MGLAELLSRLERETDERVTRIRADADAQVEAIRAAAALDARRDCEGILASRAAERGARLELELARARQRARRDELAAETTLVDRVLARVRELLDGIDRDAGYLASLPARVEEVQDPTIERLIAPRAALACAEHLAFAHGMHVLVVMADITHYCEALREIGAAREEVPGRRGYPGYMYTDLASLFERAGLVEGREGSVTLLPVLTMPDDDITHPIPDLTGYITEGQIVLSRDLQARGVSPPVDVLPSLSRLMNAGIGAGRTVPEHRRWVDQLYASYARGREARLMVAIVGESGLGAADKRALAFADAFERELVGQGRARRSLHETIERGWSLLDGLPREDLGRLGDDLLAARRGEKERRP